VAILRLHNYRGITLLSVFGKLFTKIINDILNTLAENYYVYVESQAGFRSKMGTVDNVSCIKCVNKSLFNSK